MLVQKFFFLVVCLAEIFGTVNSANFECSYKIDGVYYCDVQNDPDIKNRHSAQVDSVNGTHKSGKNNEHVLAFSARVGSTVHYFPQGLEKIFGNLLGIGFASCGLKEIHKEDLRPFTELVYLYLQNNSIQVLEKDVFEFNPKLEFVELYTNKITHIDANVFDNLSKLVDLDLHWNSRISMSANNLDEVKEIMKVAQQQCQNQDFLTAETSLKKLENNMICSDFEQVQSQVSSSNFSDFFEYRMQKLTILKNQECPVVLETTENSNLNSKSTVMNYNCLTQFENGTLAHQIIQIQNLGHSMSELITDVMKKSKEIHGQVKETKDALETANSFNSAAFTSINGRIDDLEKSMNDKMANLEDLIKNLIKGKNISIQIDET